MLSIILYLVAFHSMVVGIMLMLRPERLMAFSDLDEANEIFYPVQSGVFHIVMAVGYSMAAWDIQAFSGLVIFSITVKFIATLFLFIYYFLVQPRKIILASGIADGIMGVVILYVYSSV